LHGSNINGPVFNLATVLTKVKGYSKLSWLEILKKCTLAPVKLLNLKEKDISPKVGKLADFTIFDVEKGDFTYSDSMKNSRNYGERLHVRYTVLGKKVYYNTFTT